MTTVSLRFDDDMKRELDEICDEMGMNLTTFFTIYAKKVLRDRKIPFEISAPVDPFYSESNIRMIKKAEEQIREGKVVVKSMKELEQMEDEYNHFCGEPEPLRGELSGSWSRRITEKDRLVYEISNDIILVKQCKGHYSDR